MDVESEHYAAQQDIINKIIEVGLFKEHAAEDTIANVAVRRVARTDKSFANMMIAFLSGKISRDELQAAVNKTLDGDQRYQAEKERIE
jgi:hypothetical protein